MAVYDRWHRDARPGDKPCDCGGRRTLYPSKDHRTGKRWQVRWRDDEGKQRKRNFRLKDGRNPDLHADALDAMVSRDLDTGDYTDPSAADTTFREFAEEFRESRTHDDTSAARLADRLRLHVYPVIGDKSLKLLSKRPSLTQAWIAGLLAKGLALSYAQQIVNDASGIYQAAIGDGIIALNPVRHSSVTRPDAPPKKARAWKPERVAAMTAALSKGRYKIIPQLGAGTGLRQGEVFGLGVDDITFLSRNPTIKVLRQVKFVNGALHFALPKRRKQREIPMSKAVAELLSRHLAEYPAREVTLPWHDPRDKRKHGKPVTVRLVFTNRFGRVSRGTVFTQSVWNPARKKAGVPPGSDDGMHALRHTFASMQLGAGRAVTEVAAWMGDTPAIVLKTYAHFIPGGEDDSRAATDEFLRACAPDVPSESGEDEAQQGQGSLGVRFAHEPIMPVFMLWVTSDSRHPVKGRNASWICFTSTTSCVTRSVSSGTPCAPSRQTGYYRRSGTGSRRAFCPVPS
jgi:integrase